MYVIYNVRVYRHAVKARKSRKRRGSDKPDRYADTCMYSSRKLTDLNVDIAAENIKHIYSSRN